MMHGRAEELTWSAAVHLLLIVELGLPVLGLALNPFLLEILVQVRTLPPTAVLVAVHGERG